MSGKTNFPSLTKGWEKFETNNQLLPMFCSFQKKERGETKIHIKAQLRALISSDPCNDYSEKFSS